uniref:Dual specificity protein phosphatase 26 n=3 Tax=Camelus TaxID=9836 RepID=A0A9W3EMP4_CAMBA|nr:dual specificity protein phosphatase 26 isoform X1 [Camelus bactrianus]
MRPRFGQARAPAVNMATQMPNVCVLGVGVGWWSRHPAAGQLPLPKTGTCDSPTSWPGRAKEQGEGAATDPRRRSSEAPAGPDLAFPPWSIFSQGPAPLARSKAAALASFWCVSHPCLFQTQLPGDGPLITAATVPAASKMCPGNWLWASVTFMARFSRSGSRSPVRTRGALEEMPSVQHPFLNVFELERLLYTGKTACNHADEVWPGLYLGDQEIASNHRELRRLGITHVLNASHSRWRGTPEAYEGLGIRYLGVEAHDSPAFDMSIHFQAAADFIHRALSQPGGRILVHCAVGVSRSATLVLAYLMLYHRLSLVDAIKKVKDHRGIIPNRGFLRQLLALDRRLRQGLEA